MVGYLRQIVRLLRFYWVLEGRNRQLVNGVLLYVLAILLLVSYLFRQPEGQVWLGVYWMVLLFAAVNAGVLSFMQESGGRRWYYYQIADPLAVYVAKSLHLTGLLTLVAVTSGVLLTVFFGLPVKEIKWLVLATLGAVLGLSFLFAFLAGLSSATRHQAMLTTVLGFPLVIGLCLLAARIASAGLMSGVSMDDLRQDILMLAGLDLILGGMGVLLFAYIWRD